MRCAMRYTMPQKVPLSTDLVVFVSPLTSFSGCRRAFTYCDDDSAKLLVRDIWVPSTVTNLGHQATSTLRVPLNFIYLMFAQDFSIYSSLVGVWLAVRSGF